MQKNTGDFVAAGPFRRLAAFFYDCMLLMAVYFIIGGAAVAINGGKAIPLHWSLFISVVVFPISAFAFYCWFWRRCGQTLGMQAWRIKLIADTTPPSISLCVVRFVVSLIGLAALGAGYLWMLVDSNKRTWQDIASDSRVVHLPHN